jgi:phage tail tape-measure protein
MIEALVSWDQVAADLFHDRLAEAGYVVGLADRYQDFRYVIEGVTAYQVTKDFPRIPLSAISGGIESLQYSIRVSALHEWKTEVTEKLGEAQEIWGKTHE